MARWRAIGGAWRAVLWAGLVGSLAAELSAQVSAPGRVTPIDRQQFDIDYTLSALASEVALWYTDDGGKSWQLYGRDADSHPPISFTAQHEGLYGFKVIARNKKGASEPDPKPGSAPKFWCFIDWTAPQVRLTAPAPAAPPPGQTVGPVVLKENEPLIIAYTAFDEHLLDRPIRMQYRLLDETSWQPIVADADNSGQWVWTVPPSLTKPFLLRVMATDRVGHVGVASSKEMVIRWVQDVGMPDTAMALGPANRIVAAPTTAPETTLAGRAPPPAPVKPSPGLQADYTVGLAPGPGSFTPAPEMVEPPISPPLLAASDPHAARPVRPPPPLPVVHRNPSGEPEGTTDMIGEDEPEIGPDLVESEHDVALEQDALGMLVVEFTSGQPVTVSDFESTLRRLTAAVQRAIDMKLASPPIGTAMQGPPGTRGMVKTGRLYAIIPESHRNKEDAGLMTKVIDEQLAQLSGVIVRTRFERATAATGPLVVEHVAIVPPRASPTAGGPSLEGRAPPRPFGVPAATEPGPKALSSTPAGEKAPAPASPGGSGARVSPGPAGILRPPTEPAKVLADPTPPSPPVLPARPVPIDSPARAPTAVGVSRSPLAAKPDTPPGPPAPRSAGKSAPHPADFAVEIGDKPASLQSIRPVPALPPIPTGPSLIATDNPLPPAEPEVAPPAEPAPFAPPASESMAPLVLPTVPPSRTSARPKAEAPPPAPILPVAPADDPGEKKYGYLGIVPGALSESLADQLGLDDGSGLLVGSVDGDSPAQAVGVVRNDVLVKIDDQILFTIDQYYRLVESRKPGTTIGLELFRKGRIQNMAVRLAGTNQRGAGRPAVGAGGGGSPSPASASPAPTSAGGAPQIPPEQWNAIKALVEKMSNAETLGAQAPEVAPTADGSAQPDTPPAPATAAVAPKGGGKSSRAATPSAASQPEGAKPPTPSGPALQEQFQLRLGPAAAGTASAAPPPAAAEPAGPVRTVGAVSAASPNYRAVWTRQDHRPMVVSLYDKNGQAIFEKASPERLARLLDGLDEEARDLLAKAPLSLGPPAPVSTGAGR